MCYSYNVSVNPELGIKTLRDGKTSKFSANSTLLQLQQKKKKKRHCNSFVLKIETARQGKFH